MRQEETDVHEATYSRAGTLEVGTGGEAVGLERDQEVQSEQKQTHNHNQDVRRGWGGVLIGRALGSVDSEAPHLDNGGGNCKFVF